MRYQIKYINYIVWDVFRYNYVFFDVRVNENNDWGRIEYKGMI